LRFCRSFITRSALDLAFGRWAWQNGFFVVTQTVQFVSWHLCENTSTDDAMDFFLWKTKLNGAHKNRYFLYSAKKCILLTWCLYAVVVSNISQF
jgi:hypothetical protein